MKRLTLCLVLLLLPVMARADSVEAVRTAPTGECSIFNDKPKYVYVGADQGKHYCCIFTTYWNWQLCPSPVTTPLATPLTDPSVDDDQTIASTHDLHTSGKVCVGSLTPGSEACLSRDSSDRLWLDNNADGTKNAAEGWATNTNGNFQIGRRLGSCACADIGVVTPTCSNLGAYTAAAGTNCVAAANTAGNFMRISLTSDTVSGNRCTLLKTSNESLTEWKPKVSHQITTGSTIVNTRIWAVLVNSTGAAIIGSAPSITSSAFARSYIGLVADDAISTNWLCCSGDGTNQTCTSTGVAVAASTDYNLIADLGDGTTLRCDVNGTEVTKATNLPASGANLKMELSVVPTSAAARVVYYGRASLEQN